MTHTTLENITCYKQFCRESLIEIKKFSRSTKLERDILVAIVFAFDQAKLQQPKYVIFHSYTNDNENSVVRICRPDLPPEDMIDYEIKKLSIEENLNEQSKSNLLPTKFKIL